MDSPTDGVEAIKLWLTYASRADWLTAVTDGNITVDEASGSVSLRRGVLLCDEYGRCTRRDREEIGGAVVAKKEFVLDRADVFGAQLCVAAECRDQDAVLEILVNGEPVLYRCPAQPEYWEQGWVIVDVPVGALRQSKNEVLFRTVKTGDWCLFIEDCRWPNRSAKSKDGGRTWDYHHLGFTGSHDGEYLVRLRLDRYALSGMLTSPVIDVAELIADDLVPLPTHLGAVRTHVEADLPAGTGMTSAIRWGSTPSYSPETWSDWRSAEDSVCRCDEEGRYLQWRIILSTVEPTVTPMLQRLVLELDVEVRHNAVDGSLRKGRKQSSVTFRGSFPFAHQPANDRRLEMFRQRWHLEKVVAGAQTDLERMIHLRQWARDQWRDGWDSGVLDFVPPWDAPIILELASRGLSMGMCTHYATVFVQACWSLGMVARHVIIRQHCVAEAWSNELMKWIMMDVGGDKNDETRMTYHIERAGIPLNALELHRAWLQKDFDDLRLSPPEAEQVFSVRDRVHLFERWAVTLREDDLTTLSPGELEHGMRSYCFDKYLWWRDAETPELPYFSMHSDREADFYWSVNQTRIHLQAKEDPDTVDVQLETVTPNFSHYLARQDRGPWRRVPSYFAWSIHCDDNILEMKSVNLFGRVGPVYAVLLCLPSAWSGRSTR